MAEDQLDKADLIALVHRLYEPSSPDEVKIIEAKLQEVQRSQYGWQFGEDLLGSDSHQARFFGALTYTVKLNQEGSSMTTSNLEELLSRLLAWLVKFVGQTESRLVLRKLCSSLVTLFSLPNFSWLHAVRHLLCSLVAGQPVPENSLEQFSSAAVLCNSLDERSFTVLLTFANTLAEDVARLDRQSPQFRVVHSRCVENFPDAFDSLKSCFSLLPTGHLHQEALDCSRSWIDYVMEEGREYLYRCQQLVQSAGRGLWAEETFEGTAGFLLDSLTNIEDSEILKDVRFIAEFLQSDTAMNLLTRLESGDTDDDCAIFGQLALAYGQHLLTQSYESQHNLTAMEPNRRIEKREQVRLNGLLFSNSLELCRRVSSTQSAEANDPRLSNALIDFWEAVVTETEFMTDKYEVLTFLNFDDLEKNWKAVMSALCKSARLPLTEDGEFSSLPSAEPFFEYRVRVFGLVQLSYETFGECILAAIARDASNAYHEGNSQGLEDWKTRLGNLETLFNCLRGLPDYIQYQTHLSESTSSLLGDLFRTTLLNNMSSFGHKIPTKLQVLTLDIIGRFGMFISTDQDLLERACDTVFRSLKQPKLEDSAARALRNLCDTNRRSMTKILQQISSSAADFYLHHEASDGSKHLVAEALAALVQAVSNKDHQIQYTRKLLEMIETDYNTRSQRARQASDPRLYLKALSVHALQSLASLGRAFQTPSETPISLEDEELDATDFYHWDNEQGRLLRSTLLRFLAVLVQPLREDGEVLDAACQVLRTGFAEHNPGPFVFEAEIVAELVTSTPMNNPRIDVAVRTMTSFLTSRRSKPASVRSTLPQFLQFVYGVMVFLREPNQDPEVARDSTEALNVIISRWLSFVRQSEAEAFRMFDFSVQALAMREMLTKTAAGDLWSTFLRLRPDNTQDGDFIENIVESLGPALAKVIINDIGGLATRSQLEGISGVLNCFLTRHRMVKTWLTNALNAPEFPSPRITDQDKTAFLQKIYVVRGLKPLQAQVKDLWLQARGIPASYN